jgi:hypothetical protein
MNPLATLSNHLAEIEFSSGKRHEAPHFDVCLDVIFSRPDGKTLTVPAFWAGENRWKVRYSSAVLGEHHYVTQCHDADHLELHGLQGLVTVLPYTGNNPLLHHGAPKVASDRRHFCHDDNTPFFWLGDTWWLGLTQRLGWPDEFKALAKDRQGKGFTVVQMVAGLYPDMPAFDPRGASIAGFAWQTDFTSINPSFFDEADARIAHLVELGISPCIVGAWGYYLQWLGTAKMKQHWRYLMARWGAYPVVWVAAGEQMMPWYLSESREAEGAWLKQEWSKVVRYMREINGFNRLITTHPQQSGRSCVDDPHLLDFEMQQTGHGASTSRQAEQATEGWHAQPVMPVISGESRYEALDITPKVTTTDARQAFWAHLVNSGCAGHTYGANGVWQVNRENDPFGKSPSGGNWGSIPWCQGMQLSGSSQLALAKALLLTLPWHQLAPIAPQPTPSRIWTKWLKLLHLSDRCQRPVAAAASVNNDLAIFYSTDSRPYWVDLSHLSRPMEAVWFDPVNGRALPATQPQISSKGRLKFVPPGKNAAHEDDWVLVVKSSAA